MRGKFYYCKNSSKAVLLYGEAFKKVEELLEELAEAFLEHQLSALILEMEEERREELLNLKEAKQFLRMRGIKPAGFLGFGSAGRLLLHHPVYLFGFEFLILLSYPLVSPDGKRRDVEPFLKLSLPTLFITSKKDPLSSERIVRQLASRNPLFSFYFLKGVSRYFRVDVSRDAEVNTGLSEIICLWLKENSNL